MIMTYIEARDTEIKIEKCDAEDLLAMELCFGDVLGRNEGIDQLRTRHVRWEYGVNDHYFVST